MSPASVFSCFGKGSLRRKPAFPHCGSLIAIGASLAAACLAPAGARAQAPGAEDNHFLAASVGVTFYALTIETIDQQDRIFIGGDGSLCDRLSIVDGSFDTNFQPPVFGNSSRIVFTAVEQIVPNQADQDKTLIGGLFGKTKVTGNKTLLPAQNIARLNSDGTVDTSFNPGVGANGYVTSILPEADGTILVGGLFDRFNKQVRHHLVRLNIDGSIDGTFDPGLNVSGNVLGLANQLDPATGLPNGQILAVGLFNRVDTTIITKITRLNSDGSLDTGFNPVIDTRVDTVAVQPDGKILIGGEFTSVDGQSASGIARLNFDGSLDATFSGSITGNPPGSPTTTAVYVIKLLADGRMYIGGNFDTADGTRRNYLARLLPNGSLDTAFDSGTAVVNSVQSLAIQADNKVLVGETVSRKINNIFPPSLIRLYGDPVPTPSKAPVVVNLVANKPNASETSPAGGPVRGQFKLTRQGSDLSSSTTVYLTQKGTAVSGQDYQPLNLDPNNGTVFTRTFLPGQSVLKIGVRPTGDTLATSPETITLKLRSDRSGAITYTRGSAVSATVTLTN